MHDFNLRLLAGPSHRLQHRNPYRPDADGIYTVTFAVTNISDAPANAGEIWVYICDQCTWAAEPNGFDKPPGLVEQARHKAFQLLNPGVSLADLTIKFEIAGGPFAYTDLAFNYSWSTYGTMSPKMQTIRNFLLPAANWLLCAVSIDLCIREIWRPD